MISETLPLNEWPIEHLYKLYVAIEVTNEKCTLPDFNSIYDEILPVIKQAIKDAEFEKLKLPFK